MKPNRLKVAITGVERFIYEFLDRNPMSTLGLVATRGGSAFVIADPMSNPVELGTGTFFFLKGKMDVRFNFCILACISASAQEEHQARGRCLLGKLAHHGQASSCV
jgi:hypothetical protein